jgi:hypothetical protein
VIEDFTRLGSSLDTKLRLLLPVRPSSRSFSKAASPQCEPECHMTTDTSVLLRNSRNPRILNWTQNLGMMTRRCKP